MVRKVAIKIAKQRNYSTTEFFKEAGSNFSCDATACIDNYSNIPGQSDVRENCINIAIHNIDVFFTANSLLEILLENPCAHCFYIRLGAHLTLHHHFKSIKRSGTVAGRNDNAAGGFFKNFSGKI